MRDLAKMYNAFFGLSERPFSLLPDPEFLYWATPHTKAYTMLEYGIATHAPITVITGEVGSGKTTLVRKLLNEIPQDYSVGLISNAQGGRGELLHWVLMALGQEPDPSKSYVQLFRQFQDFLIEEYAAGRRTALIFDEAQNLTPETLEELRMFSNINADKDELLQLILVGQPELRELISRPDLTQFAQRIASEFHLRALTLEEAKAYIAHRLAIAGAERRIFTDEACRMIHAASRGTPRLINQLCDYALVYAFADERPDVDADIVAEVLRDRGRYGVFETETAPTEKPHAAHPPAKDAYADPTPPSRTGITGGIDPAADDNVFDGVWGRRG